MTRVAIFIDGSNLYHSLKKDFGRANIDFAKFVQKLVAGRELVRVYYYNAPIPQEPHNKIAYRKQQQFFDYLRDLPYFRVTLGRLEQRPAGLVEKGVDINIAVDMLRYAFDDLYDVAILVSGDGDFASAVQAVQDRGKHVENAISKSGQSRHLRQTCDTCLTLDETMLADIWLK